MRWWPRSIRWQMLAGLLLLETLSIGSVRGFCLSASRAERSMRARSTRLSYEAASLAMQAAEALRASSGPAGLAMSVKMMGEAPTVAMAKVTDPAGNMLSSARAKPTR